MSAILFGSLSTLADTSELQRESFNEAFAQHGLRWQWDRNLYREMLSSNGGADRISAYAASTGETVDAASVHQTKSVLFRQKLAATELAARPGVTDTIERAKTAGIKLAFVTTTSPANISALFTALSPHVSAKDFDVIVSTTDVQQSKPDPAPYLFALKALGEQPADVVAIEDNVGGGQAATTAGVPWIAFPNENTGDQSFTDAAGRMEQLDADHLSQLVTPA